MPTTYKRTRGQDMELVASKLASGATALTNWKDFSANAVISEDEATAAPSPYEQFTPGTRKATIDVKGFTGNTEIMPDLPQPGDELLTLAAQTVTEGADLLLDLSDEAKWGKVIVTEVDYTQTGKPGEWGFKARTGGILPPVVEEEGG